MKYQLLVPAVIAALAFPAAAEMVSQRAYDNYQAVASGQRPFHSLSLEEQREVAEIDRFRTSKPRKSFAQKCREDQKLAGKTPTKLEEAAIRLKCSEP